MASTTRSGRKAGSAVSGAGSLARKFERLGLRTAVDFVVHLPLRYEDETRLTPIAEVRVGAHVVIEGEVIRSEMRKLGGTCKACHDNFRVESD